MEARSDTSPLLRARFEVLPFARSVEEAAQLPGPERLTVTCSPKHGPDRSLEVAGELRALGHEVTLHLAARMVGDPGHLDRIISGMAEAGIDDLFLIGGDADPPAGAYGSAGELIELVAAHPRRPRTIGIAGYPEGHPAISDDVLADALAHKTRFADYVTTQMCFDHEALLAWVTRHRESGMTLPVHIGMPGQVSRTKLIELSARIGVGPSLRFLRKQRGIRALLSKRSTGDKLYDKLAPTLDDADLGIAGLHIFTFNQLLDSWRWQRARGDTLTERSHGDRQPRRIAEPERGPA